VQLLKVASRTAVVLALAASLLSVWGCSAKQKEALSAIQTQQPRVYRADISSCEMRDSSDKECTKWKSVGVWAVALNSVTNTCVAMLENSPVSASTPGSQFFFRSDSLSFIDTSTWECEASRNSGKDRVLVQMSHGVLNILELSHEGGPFDPNYRIDPRRDKSRRR
jgi:hypothetical protein